MVFVRLIARMSWNNGVYRITPVTAPIAISVATDRILVFLSSLLDNSMPDVVIYWWMPGQPAHAVFEGFI